MADIFISYASQDKARIRPLAEALKAEGWTVFWDRAVKPGENWHKVIGQQLKASRCVVVAWSKASVESDWVLEEAVAGKQRNALIPVNLDAVDIPFGFGQLQSADLAAWDGSRESAEFHELIAAITDKLGPPPEAPARVGLVEPPAKTVLTPAESTSRPEEASLPPLEAVPESPAAQPTVPDVPIPPPAREEMREHPARPSPASSGAKAVETSVPPSPANTHPMRKSLIWIGVVAGLFSLGAVLKTKVSIMVGDTPPSHESPRPEQAQVPGQPVQGQAVPVIEPEMIRIKPGQFQMGSKVNPDEQPVHLVKIAKPFAIGRYEVTFEQYDQYARAEGKPLPDDKGWGRGNRPVINVSWDDAVAYAGWLSAKTGKRHRLPTEAEWEYAARAGTQTEYWWGDEIGKGRANCDRCGSQWDNEQTAPVGSFPANPWGLQDTAGNIWEWVMDSYHENYLGAPADGQAWIGQGDAETGRRVVRGGSWFNIPDYLRSATRYGLSPGLRNDNVGFRLAQDL